VDGGTCVGCHLADHEPTAPGYLQQLRDFVASAAAIATSGLKRVEEAEYQRRLGVCGECPFFKNQHCMKCGCAVEGTILSKARYASAACPLGKW
jgi:hypothetical protein